MKSLPDISRLLTECKIRCHQISLLKNDEVPIIIYQKLYIEKALSVTDNPSYLRLSPRCCFKLRADTKKISI